MVNPLLFEGVKWYNFFLKVFKPITLFFLFTTSIFEKLHHGQTDVSIEKRA